MMDCFDLPRRRQQLTNLKKTSSEMLKISEDARQTAIRDMDVAIETIRKEIRRIDERC